PDAYTGCVHIETAGNGRSETLRFAAITAENVAGAVVYVGGTRENPARSVDVRNCRFHNCGKFMWDYGYLWQRIVFSSRYSEKETANAFRYMPAAEMSSPLFLRDGKLFAEKMPAMRHAERDQVTFFGETMPEGIKRGKQYAVLNRGTENGLVIAEDFGQPPLVFSSLPEGLRLFRNMFYVFHDLFSPVGATQPQKGSIDVTLCRDVSVSGCRISASGDSMHILECRNVVFSGNQITGARMGAFYIGFHCDNVTVTGNTVDGSNGSRVVSVERSSENIVITGNTFRNGGRGSWFNQPKNIIISDNLFLRNTGKSTPSLTKGRVCQATGDFEQCPELYFTTWEENGTYGPVLLRGNIIETEETAQAAVAFNAGGRDLRLEGNCVRGGVCVLQVAAGCEPPFVAQGQGFTDTVEGTYVNTANVR
ncbi:MAG: right-handed parallel beta-helix repeat-containing protein, partial [Clostridia bacterium]|nr:right-handed parallel beta-helix repeat-containing protein [Clostridia bacterium]